MSLVVAIEDGKGGVFFGSDSFVGHGDTRHDHGRPKWFVKGSVTFGWAGDLYPAQFLESSNGIRKQTRGESDSMYLTSHIVPEVQRALKETSGDTDFLLGHKGRVYTLWNGALVPTKRGFHAVGSGEPYALGALAVLSTMGGLDIPERIRRCLNVSEDYCYVVRGPVFVSRFFNHRGELRQQVIE